MRRLHIPGPITGVCGSQGNPIGSGKSFIALSIAFQLAEQLGYDVVTNFALDARELACYFQMCGYLGLYLKIIKNQGVYVRSVCSDDGKKLELETWMDKPRTIYVLDEAGVFTNARNFKNISMQFLSDLAQIRHDGRRLIHISQFYDQVDKQLRALTSSYIQADCQCKYDAELDSTKILWKNYKLYEARKFIVLQKKLENGSSAGGLKYWFQSMSLSMKTWMGRLTENDKQLFNCYGSFMRVDQLPAIQNPFPTRSPKVHYVTYDAQLQPI